MSDLKTQAFQDARLLVLSLEATPGSLPSAGLVRDVLGLTLGEARLANLIGAGLTPREAASELSITEASVRTVLKRIFSKTGVARQAELVALLSRVTLRDMNTGN